MLPPEQLKELKELAHKATPGEWEYNENFLLVRLPDEEELKSIATHRPDYNAINVNIAFGMEACKANARYLAAANPSAILALIEDYESKQEALHGMFLLVDQLKACMNMEADAGVEETIQGVISRINDIDGQLSGAMNANGEAQEIIAELEK